MKKRSGGDHEGRHFVFRLLIGLPAVFFLISLSRGIWNYQDLPEVVPALFPVLWPFSLPLPRVFYLLLPLLTGAFLFGSLTWSRKKERMPSPVKDEEASLEEEQRRRGQGSVGRLRQQVSRPGIVSFILQVIVVAFYSYIQEKLLSILAGGPDFPSLLSRFYGWVVIIFLTVFLFSLIIRMYRKDNTLD